MPQLSHLQLSGCSLLPCHQYKSTPQAVAALLQSLAGLSRLQRLDLENIGLGGLAPLQGPGPYPHLPALNSSLTALSLTAWQDAPMPGAMVPFLFPKGSKMQLQEVTIAAFQARFEKACINGRCLEHIIDTCPLLTMLDIRDAVADTDLSVLLRLTQSCSSLAE